MALDHPTRITIPEHNTHDPYSQSDSPSNAFFKPHTRCSCFNIPCLTRPPSSPTHPTLWRRVWSRPIQAFKKLREWSEIVAGPKWKTFIRRFNKRHHHNNNNTGTQGKFQYDPLSYALNFDEGQNGQFDEEYYGQFPDFSSRFVSLPISSRSSMDLGKANGAPAAV